MSTKNMIKYFRPPLRKISRLPAQLTTEFRWYDDASEDEQLIMSYMKARTPAAARALMAKYNVSSAVELIKLLPKPRRPSLSSRLKLWLMRLEGAQRVDPLVREYRELRKSRKGEIPGVSGGKLR